MMKKQILPLILALCLFCLGGCELGTLLSGKPKPEQPGVLVRKDKEELVELRIENGEAELLFNIERWDALYGIREFGERNYPGAALEEGPFPLELQGRVKDACIGKVAELNTEWAEPFAMPAVLLLMEDGSVAWTQANPYMAAYGLVIDPLPWLGGIASLSYESDREGFGNMTIYAIGNDGARYDVRIPCGLISVFAAEWISGYHIDDPGHVLKLNEDGTFSLNAIMGTYKIALEEDADQRPGTITFYTQEKEGSYFVDYDGFLLRLFPADGGDPLGLGDVCEFFQPEMYMGYEDEGIAIPEMDEDELIAYLLANVEEAYERVHIMRGPLEAKVPGDVTDLPDETGCRDVWLGDNHGGTFNVVIRYTVASSGAIYEYFPDEEQWRMMYHPSAVG